MLLPLLVAGAVYALFQLEYREDIADFLPDNDDNERINAVYRHIGNTNRIAVYFSEKDSLSARPEHIMEAIDRFTSLLEEGDSLHHIPEIISKIDENALPQLAGFITGNAPYFLTDADYGRMDSLLSSADFVSSRLSENKRLLMLPSGDVMKHNIMSDPLHLFTPLLLKLKDASANNDMGTEVINGYLFFNNGRRGAAFLTSPYGSSETNKNTGFMRTIEAVMQQVEADFPAIQVTCLGVPAISVTNATQVKKDGLLAVSISTVLILFLLIYFFRNTRNISLIFLSVLFGCLFALAAFACLKGSISIIAMAIGSIFVGIAINYPLHFIDHIKHQKNIKQAIREIAPPLLIGNITTVGAFFSLVFINSNALRDLGLFSSLLLVGTILFVLIVLPHLVAGVKPEKIRQFSDIKYLGALQHVEIKAWFICLMIALTGVFFYLSRYTVFEWDMTKINYLTDQQRADMEEMMQYPEQEDRSVVYLVAEGKQLNDALAVHEGTAKLLDSLRQTQLVESISGIGPFIRSKEEQGRRIRQWNDFWSRHRKNLLQQIEKEAAKEGFNRESFRPFVQLLQTRFEPQDESYFAPLVSLLSGRYIAGEANRHLVITLLYCDEDRIDAIESRIKDQAPEGTFFFNSRSIGQGMIDSVSGNFNYVLYVCGLIVFVFLTLSFGRMELSLMSFLPLAVGWIWILGIMQLCGIEFNIINIILATFIFGQGDDYTIFMTEGLMYEYTYRRKILDSYKNSIILSAIIMFIAIGTLIFAKHPALHSLAEVTITGMFSVVLMAYIIPPAIFRWLTQKGGRYREIPVTLKRLLIFCYALVFFLAGIFYIVVRGFFLFGCAKKTEKRRLRYHTILYRMANYIMRHIPGTKFHYENLSRETFDKPAIIISNHQSALDLMCIMMLTPRLVILTNDWVWNSPFIGPLCRYADFYPVSGGLEQGMEKLSERVRNGYSIVVFPEGTRSEDCSILRFHRGAFYLAEKLNLDILPVCLHGIGHVLPKSDLLLREGSVTVQVHPRIEAGDMRYATAYSARTRQIRRYYRDTCASLSRRLETAAYFRYYVLHNYLYKGRSVERQVKNILKTTNCYAQWIDAYQGEGCVLVVNNGLGVFSFIFALVHKHVQVVAVDRDENSVALANACPGIPPNLIIYREQELPANMNFERVYTLENEEVVNVVS
ncbi:MAG: 1-acyl-sn-glycerol-3-phosphate acyltransferase [Dysgonamonadaceae bacterium]|nr:1-acyl-sn-glycerol-3-phosphate acyltransferase [Dysgonamonadaceae bacterium]